MPEHQAHTFRGLELEALEEQTFLKKDAIAHAWIRMHTLPNPKRP